MKPLNKLRLNAGIPIDPKIEITIKEDTVSVVTPAGDQQQPTGPNDALKYLNAAFKSLGNQPEVQQKVKELIGIVVAAQQQQQHQPAAPQQQAPQQAQQPAQQQQSPQQNVEQEEEVDDEESITFQALVNAEDEECSCMKESVLDYSTTLNLTNANSDNPTNVVDNKNQELVYKPVEDLKDESPNQIENNPSNDMGTVKIPDSIKSALTSQASEAKKQAAKFERVRDFDSKNFYNDLANAFEELAGHLDGTVYGMKKAQIFMSSLMGPMLHKIPADVVKFIARGGQNRSLKDYVQAVKQQ